MAVSKLDRKLIDDFRKKVNETWAVYHIYKNHNGKDQWGVICSAMDWIDVSIDGVDVSLLSGENSNDASRKMMSFLSCLDVMWEGISQLYRVLYETNKIPLPNDRAVFKQTKTDNKHFKDIRAIFMAHPVNLEDIYGKSDKWFASWSGGQFSKKNFSVFLYSNIPGKQAVEFPISFCELMEFANKRYMLLLDFIKKIDEIVGKYNDSWRRVPIPTPMDPLEHIAILIEENKNRWTDTSLETRLEYLYDAFSITPFYEKNKQVLEEYRCALLNDVKEIHNMLQDVDYEHEIKGTKVNVPHNLIYMYDQLYDDVPALENIGVKTFRPIVDDTVNVDDPSLCIEGVRVLIDAALWKKSEKSE